MGWWRERIVTAPTLLGPFLINRTLAAHIFRVQQNLKTVYPKPLALCLLPVSDSARVYLDIISHKQCFAQSTTCLDINLGNCRQSRKGLVWSRRRADKQTTLEPWNLGTLKSASQSTPSPYKLVPLWSPGVSFLTICCLSWA